MDKKERDAVERDRILFGTGIAVDGKRVDPARVTISPAAPAPSSLAGGEVEKLRALLERHQEERRMVRMKDTGAVYDTTLDLDTKLALAALSPEAPAREGEEIGEEVDNAAHCVTLAECPPGLFLWNGSLGFKSEYGAMEPDDAKNGKHWKVGNRADAYCADSGEYFWGGTSTHDDRAKVLVYPIDAGKVAMVASHGPAALTPRHEAPAEGAGEDLLSAIDAFMPSAEVAFLWSKETPPADEVQRYRERYWAVKEALLRARSSAPEAREEALGNLLAVIHGDGGHRALEVGVEQAAAEAEKIVARLLSSAPEAREREAVAMVVRKGFSTGSLRYTERGQHADLQDGTKLYTHPAAPSADKLREVLIDLTSWFTKPVQGQNGMVWVIPAGEMGADDAVNAALAALKAEGC